MHIADAVRQLADTATFRKAAKRQQFDNHGTYAETPPEDNTYPAMTITKENESVDINRAVSIAVKHAWGRHDL